MTVMAQDALHQFRNALAARGLCPDAVIADGTLQRCDVDGKRRGNRAGAYLLHLDGLPAGGLENFTDGMGWQNWRAATAHHINPAQQAQHRARMEASRKARAEALASLHRECREQSAHLWQQARELVSGSHPYLQAKGIKPYGARQLGQRLLVPVRGVDSTLHGLQFIGPDGSKKFKTGTDKRGHYCALGGKPADGATLIVCEGWSTGCTLHETTGHAVAVAFDAGNLRPVCEALAGKLPSVVITVAGDTDVSGTGQQAAREAAQAIGACMALPSFEAFTAQHLAACGFTTSKPPSDFNDLHQLQRATCMGRAA